MDPRRPDIPPAKIISALRRYRLLPAIVFLPTRRRCDESATEIAGDRSQPANTEKEKARLEIFTALSEMHPEIIGHKHTKTILRAGVAAHHAGHIPAWKLLIEKMMSAGLLDAIFATSTVAAGVDFPARSVVISNADTRGNDGWRPLTANELQQMTGRAGRRGRDNVGFAILAPGQFQNPRKIAELLRSPPDKLESRFRATYTSLLNLLDAFGNFEQVREITDKSFAFRSKGPGGKRLRSDEVWQQFEDRSRVLDHLGYLDRKAEKVTDEGKWLADLRIDRPLLVGEALRSGIFSELQPKEMAGLIASVAADSDRNYGEMHSSRKVEDLLTAFDEIIVSVSKVEWRFGVEPDETVNYSAAAAAERWAQGMDWDELVERTRAEEGDLVRLLSRTGEALRQIAGIRVSDPSAAAIAAAAAEAMLREPVR
jgi:superfamily II RNA helicase